MISWAGTGIVFNSGQAGLCCDTFGCDEWHPIDHDMLGEPSFEFGRWLGWLYLDANRPDMFPRVFRFCSVSCMEHWLGQQRIDRFKGRNLGSAQEYEPVPPWFEQALKLPKDEVTRRRAVAQVKKLEAEAR